MRIHTVSPRTAAAFLEHERVRIEEPTPLGIVPPGTMVAIHDGTHIVGHAKFRYLADPPDSPQDRDIVAMLDCVTPCNPIPFRGHYWIYNNDRLPADIEAAVMGREPRP